MSQNEQQYKAFAFRDKEDVGKELRELKKRVEKLEELVLNFVETKEKCVCDKKD